ncbi:MAG: response regulator, partial [Deltaproteobacteria bacterium]|nr:response regulator [Deltaproteobacteria bacterium]
NLVGNAVKFTEHGEVVVSVGRADEYRVPGTGYPVPGESREQPASDAARGTRNSVRLLFTVRDTGIGIPEEKQAELFQAFTQLDASLARTHGGTGLGLTISKRIVDLMGGRLWVESRPGEGSTFSFELALPAAEPAGVSGSTEPVGLAGRRALVLDDSATAAAALAQALEARGLEVAAVSRCHEAVEALRAAARAGRPFDVALLDRDLGDGDGFSVVERLRHELPLAERAVMLIPSNDVPRGAARVRRLGIAGYLVKPVRLSTLLQALGDVLAAEAAPADEAVHAGRALPELRPGLRVLLAEDNPVNQTFVGASLAKVEAKVTFASDGRSALRALEKGEFDVVLMDVQMPGMDGYEATRALRARGLRLPVLGLTAHAMKGDREACLAAGMDDYLTKPISPEALCRKLALWTRECRPACPSVEPEPPADLEKLRQELGGDPAVLSALTGHLRATTEELLPAIERAAREREPAELQAAAHKLRGGLLVFQAKEAAAAAEELEHLGREGRTEGAEELHEELKAAVERLLAYLKAA